MKAEIVELGKSKTTTNHEEIKKLAKVGSGKPAVLKGTGDIGKGGGLLRINFLGGEEESLENINWEKLFNIFDHWCPVKNILVVATLFIERS